jgi:hypothetical protein
MSIFVLYVFVIFKGILLQVIFNPQYNVHIKINIYFISIAVNITSLNSKNALLWCMGVGVSVKFFAKYHEIKYFQLGKNNICPPACLII